MRKYKQFVIGFLVGAILFSIAPVSAAIEEFLCYKADYKVMVNGSEYISEELPILNYKGNTYAPFRSILEKAGLNVNWNAELGQAEVTSSTTLEQITTDGLNSSNSTKTIEYDTITGLPVGIEYVEKTYNGKTFKLAVYDGESYISSSDLKIFYGIQQGYLDVKNGLRTLYKDDKTVVINLMSNDYFSANGYSYYKESLLIDLMGE
jgi:hypothetical protein